MLKEAVKFAKNLSYIDIVWVLTPFDKINSGFSKSNQGNYKSPNVIHKGVDFLASTVEMFIPGDFEKIITNRVRSLDTAFQVGQGLGYYLGVDTLGEKAAKNLSLNIFNPNLSRNVAYQRNRNKKLDKERND